ncbi:hypothetical protein P7C70_g7547, partial [Phenoliferia sp. Uapishka_3]
MRETWEEVGLDLAEKEWLCVGSLDDREITTSLGKRLLMILSPYVFLNTSPHTPLPELQESEVASAHWIPIEQLHAPQAQYGRVGIDIATRLAPRNAVARFALKLLVGTMHFRCVLLPNSPCAIGQTTPLLPNTVLPPLKLWGLTLGMTLDLLSSMAIPSSSSSGSSPTNLSTYPHAVSALDLPLPLSSSMSPLPPSTSSIFPTFSYPDINILIWIFGFRYRRLMKQTKPRSPKGKEVEEDHARVDWMGARVLGSYYEAVRRALVVAVVLRALAAGAGVGTFVWWLKVRNGRRAKVIR